MKKILFLFLLIFNLIYPFTGEVTRVFDGDTITVLSENGKSHLVRFYGIDAPDSFQSYKKESTEILRKWINGKTVTIEEKNKDYFGLRTVGIVFLNGENINLKMVAEGHAWWDKRFAKNNEELEMAEDKAKTRKLGLWKAKNPVAPWVFTRRLLID